MIALDRDQLRARAQDRAGQAAGAGTNLEGGLVFQGAGDGGDAVQQLLVQQEILAQRLARLKPVGGDDVSKGRKFGAEFSSHE